MVGIFIIIAAVFIGAYFYKSASNIEKNGLLWVGIALAAFLTTSMVTSLMSLYLLGLNGLLVFFVGLAFGLSSLFVVNHFMNIIPE